MSYPIDREPEIRRALDEFLKQLGWMFTDMEQYVSSETDPLSPEDLAEFVARHDELVALQHTCMAFKQTLWDGVLTDELV
jgi:hypothetical protein